MADKILHRRDIEQNFIDNNTVLSEGEFAYSTDTKRVKIGDGYSKWTQLQDIHGIKQMYGVEWNSADSSPELNRIGLAYGLQQPDFDQIYPWSEIKKVGVQTDGTKTYDPVDDGTGADGEIMVEIPKFWYRREVITSGTGDRLVRWYVSDEPWEGYEVFPCFLDSDGNEKDFTYVGAYPGVLYDNSAGGKVNKYVQGDPRDTPSNDISLDLSDDKLCSTAGFYPLVGSPSNEVPPADFRSIAQNRGPGWGIMNIYQISAIQMLYTVEYNNLNSQSTLGQGITDKNYDDIWRAEQNGASYTGRADYRGIENIFGNVWQFIDGLQIKDDGYHVGKDNDSLTEHYATTPLTTEAGDSDNYISDIEDIVDFGFFPKATNGSSSTYFCDYCYIHGSEETNVARLGGNWFNGSRAGLFVWDWHVPASSSVWYVGARLAYTG